MLVSLTETLRFGPDNLCFDWITLTSRVSEIPLPLLTIDSKTFYPFVLTHLIFITI